MWIFRVNEPRLGAIRVREWTRRARRTVGLLFLDALVGKLAARAEAAK